MKNKFLIFLVLVVLISGCSLEQERDTNNETGLGDMETIDNYNQVNKRVFIDLEYFGCAENIDLSGWYTYPFIDESVEFTWWYHTSIPENHILSGIYRLNDEAYKIFDFNLPENIDRANKNVVVSYGRQLKYLYYYADKYVYEDGPEGYYGRPVFEREYNGNVAYIYLIDKIKLTDNEFYGRDLSEFNERGNIPFELPSED